MLSIHYAQCWEDPQVLADALAIGPFDDVVSIGSAGDNTFALLLDNPHSVTVVDQNPAQISLIELKIKALQQLDYDDFVGFLGARACRNRAHLYSQLRQSLLPEARAYWDDQPAAIQNGIIHCGKFERYFAIFRRIVLPLIHRSPTVLRLLSSASLGEQKSFYDNVWNNRRWRLLFRLFFGKLILGHLGRDPSTFNNVQLEKIAETLFQRSRHGLTGIPMLDNFFLEYILTGKYSILQATHPYLREANFHLLKERVGQLRLVCSGLDSYLATCAPDTISKFNLSDVFEYMSEAIVEQTLRQIIRVGRDNGKLAFWTLFVPRPVPSTLAGFISSNSALADKLHAADRAFFYGSFCLWNVSHNEPLNHRKLIEVSGTGTQDKHDVLFDEHIA